MKFQQLHAILAGVFLALHTADSFLPTSTNHPSRLPTECYAKNMKVAVVGGGPSGLLLTHLLLLDKTTEVTLLEGREDPLIKGTEQRAYALGVGIRGRTAIRQVDEELWKAVKRKGYESERFQLHVGGFVIPLRDGSDGAEPSLLTFQSELCAGLTEELVRRHGDGGRLQLKFGTRVKACDLNAMKVTLEDSTTELENETFDLIVGCDGVNSPVRAAMEQSFPGFQTSKEQLPGEFKVVRLNTVPPKVDPTAVSLILPRKGSSGAFVEPTGDDGSCCILFSGRGDTPILRETNNVTAVVEELKGAFPLWEGFHELIAEQLMAQTVTGTASSVVCNTYNFGGKAALAGDAAHATGGVSGQGVNSALADVVVLAQCLRENRDNIAEGLLKYSFRQVPEGKALYDLSFGPKPKGLQGVRWAVRNARDTLFRGRFGIGRPPLQTRLTTDLTSFADIRRESDEFYEAPFPSIDEFEATLRTLHETAIVGTKSSHSIVANSSTN